jgi:hypothetical protein
MAAKDFSPCDTDILQASKYILSFPRISATQFFCQAINLPGVSTNPTGFDTPFSNLPIPGDKIQYEPLVIEFLIDEELQSWRVIYEWIYGISFPTEFAEYKNLKDLSRFSQDLKHPQYADAELILLSASNNPKIRIKFVDLFPISLGGISLDLRLDSSHIITASATFKYSRYNIEIA